MTNAGAALKRSLTAGAYPHAWDGGVSVTGDGTALGPRRAKWVPPHAALGLTLHRCLSAVRPSRCAAFRRWSSGPGWLRHSFGYKLPNEGVHPRPIQAFLGHKSIQHTVKHTELAPTRFE